MCPNDAGRMVRSVWDDIQTVYPGVETDAFVVMPNHVHAIIIIVATAPIRLALPGVVHRFK